MIIVFGSIHIEIPLMVDQFAKNENPAEATYIEPYPGGKGANQALAAMRAGAEKVAIVGQTGDDEFSVTILNSLRREGVMTSGVAKNELPTGMKIFIEDNVQRQQVYFAPAANTKASADQVPDEILQEGAFVLLQTEITPEENAGLLARAKERGATTILNLSPSIDISQKMLNHLDYFIVNREEAARLAEKLGLKTGDSAMQMAEGFAKQGKLNCIITKGAQGAVGVSASGEAWRVEALPLEKVVDRSGAEDSYCGALTAFLHEGHDLPQAMKRASVAASLACAEKGGSSTFPHLDKIEKHLGDIEEPEKVS